MRDPRPPGFGAQWDAPEPDDPNTPPSSDAWIIYESAHVDTGTNASVYFIVFIIEVLGPGPGNTILHDGYEWGDTASPPTPTPIAASYDAVVPVVLTEGQTYSVNVRVESGGGSGGGNQGGVIDFQFSIGNLRVDFESPE